MPPQHLDRVRWRDLFFKNITVHTSVDPDFKRDFPLAMRWIGEARIDVSKVITHRYKLDQIQTAFETFRDRKEGAIKVLVEFPAYRHSKSACGNRGINRTAPELGRLEVRRSWWSRSFQVVDSKIGC